MQLPEGILENTEAALALLAAGLSAAGLLLCLAAYAALFLSLQSAEKAILPQFDSASAALSDAQQVVSSAAESAGFASLAVGNVSSALYEYADASRGLSDSLGAIASNPLFSLDPSIASSASKMEQASDFFSGAASSLNSSASGAASAASSVRKLSDDLSSAKNSLEGSRSGLQSAFGALNLAALLAAICICALFSAVLSLSVSVLLSHYPRMFGGGKKQQAQEKPKPPKG